MKPPAATEEDGRREGWYRENTNDGLCMCGCGEPAPIADRTARHFGTIKGKPRMYVRGHIGSVNAKSAATRAKMSASAYRRWQRERTS